jgi:hypothetical protein
MNGGMSAIAQSRHQLHLKSVRVCASLPSSRALIWNGRTDGNRGRQFVVGYAIRALTARAGFSPRAHADGSVDSSIQFQLRRT